jgi:c-di-GMP phosphodiesterase Gmr
VAHRFTLSCYQDSMKEWTKEHFAKSETASLSARLVARQNFSEADPDHAWLDSLPIAAIIYRLENGGVLNRLSSNKQFEELMQNRGKQIGLDVSILSDRIATMVKENRDTHFEKWTSQNEITRCELDISIASFGTEDDHYLISFVDKTAEVVGRINLRREMMHDSLTGFSNRIGFEDRVEKVTDGFDIGDDSSHRFAMVIFDLARFSRINESVGVLAGDELIITIARRLNGRIRQNEIVGRIGGNEFALFAWVKDDKNAEAIARRVTEAFDTPCKLSNLEIKLDCAAAAAIGELGRDEPMEVLRNAQLALKKAKASKKFELFSNDKLDLAKHRFSIETDLRRALERDELELHYQPLIDLDSGKLNGFEALARWNHPERGYISPVDFIAVAEECGLIIPLGRWALSEASKTIAEWDRKSGQELPCRMSVNLSVEQLKRDDIRAAVEEALLNAGIDGNRLTLELTESALVDDPEGTRATLNALKQLNTVLAMDDFGTGYSNLAYLQKLPIDVLKIDRSFIMDIMGNKDSQAIVTTILSLASTLGMKTTAEGIESKQISDKLRSLGCTNGQGYFYAKPLERDAAYSFLMESMAATN